MKEKKCKICKEVFKPLRNLQMVCSPKCGFEYSNQQKQKEWNKKKKKLKKELLTVQDWLKLAQQAFNAYIRERDKDKNCISCDKPLKGKYDAGHYYSSGGHKNVTLDPMNVHGQCVACNQHKHGNLQQYRKGLIKRFNETFVEQLDDKAQETRKFTREELKDITEHYKQKLKALKDDKRKS